MTMQGLPLLTRVALLTLIAGASTACATRRILEVRSDPPGAVVELDGQRAGRTPLDLPFEHYGQRQVTLTYPGHQIWSETVELDSPWWSDFPVDIVTELILPFGWTDRHRVEAFLELDRGEVLAPDLDGVLSRARALRRMPDPLIPEVEEAADGGVEGGADAGEPPVAGQGDAGAAGEGDLR